MFHARRAVIGASTAAALAVAIVAGGSAGIASAVPTDSTAAAQPAAPTADHQMGSSMDAQSLSPQAVTPSGIRGIDVSYFQGDDTTKAADGSTFKSRLAAQVGAGVQFAFVKTTEGTPGTVLNSKNKPATTGTMSSRAAVQYKDITAAGLYVGTYHFALPAYSSGATQAAFYLQHDVLDPAYSKNLPPVLDMEVDDTKTSTAARCWNLSTADMVSWIQSWVGTVVAAKGVQPLIYTNQDFWNSCTGNSSAFPKDRLFVASYSGTATPVVPTGLHTWLFWQWSEGARLSTNPNDPDISAPNLDVFNGTASQLATFSRQSARSVGRLAGGNAYATAGSIAASAFTPTAPLNASNDAPTKGTIPVAYVATRSQYPDALSAAAAAGFRGAPVLLTDPNTIPAATIAELQELNPQKIVLVGGTSAISTAVEKDIAKYAATTPVGRLSGSSRYNTSAAIAASTFPANTGSNYANGLTAYIATGTNFPDALAGAAVAAGNAEGPMLLVKPTSIDQSVKDQLARLRPNRIVILGGTAAVSADVQQQLAAYVGNNADKVQRWAGNNRFDTSVVIAQHAFTSARTAFVATGTNFPDALAGAPAAGAFAAPVLLVRPDSVQANVRSELSALGTKGVVVLGGPVAVNAAVEASF